MVMVALMLTWSENYLPIPSVAGVLSEMRGQAGQLLLGREDVQGRDRLPLRTARYQHFGTLDVLQLFGFFEKLTKCASSFDILRVDFGPLSMGNDDQWAS